MDRLKNLTSYEDDRFRTTIVWDGTHGVIRGTIKTQTPAVNVDDIIDMTTTVSQYLYDNGITDDDNLTLSVGEITLMYNKNRIDLFNYISHPIKRDLIGESPTVKDVYDRYYQTIITQDNLPELNGDYHLHVELKTKRILSVFRVLQKGTYEDKPYVLKPDPQYCITTSDPNFTLRGKVISPEFNLSLTLDVEEGPMTQSFRQYLIDKFKHLGVDQVLFV